MEWLQVGTHQVSLQLWLLWIFACPLGLEDIFLMNIEFTATNLANYMWYMPLFVMISVHAVTDQVKLTWLGGRKESGYWFWFGIYLFIFLMWGSFIRRNTPIAIIQWNVQVIKLIEKSLIYVVLWYQPSPPRLSYLWHTLFIWLLTL